MRRFYRTVISIGVACAAAAAFAQDFSGPDAGDPRRDITVSPAKGDDDPIQLAAPAAVCFTEGTPDAYIQEITNHVMALNAGLISQRYDLVNRWPGAQGAPLTIRWSFYPEGLNIPNQIGEGANTNELFSRMDALFGGNRNLWITRFEQSFARWGQLTGLNYVRITNGTDEWDDGAAWGSQGSATRGDVRIGMKPIDGSNGILAFNLFPNSGDMVLDRAEAWGNSTNQHRFLRNTIMHEHGHGLGIAHVCSNNRAFLMEPFLQTSFDGPRQDDVRAGQRNYGDVSEPDNGSGNPNNLGSLAPGDSAVNYCDVPAPQTGSTAGGITLCSLDADGENDWYVFDISGPANITVFVSPSGGSYDDNPQAGNGGCPSGNTTDTGDLANLALQVYESDGTTILADVNDTGKGDGETAALTVAAGTYFIRVWENGTGPSGTQFYDIELMTESAATCPSDLNQDGSVDLSDLAVLLGNFGRSGQTMADGDIDGNGTVDLSDLAILLGEFGRSC